MSLVLIYAFTCSYAVMLHADSTYSAVHLDTTTFACLEMALAQMPGSLIPLVEMNVLAVGRDSQGGLVEILKISEVIFGRHDLNWLAN